MHKKKAVCKDYTILRRKFFRGETVDSLFKKAKALEKAMRKR